MYAWPKETPIGNPYITWVSMGYPQESLENRTLGVSNVGSKPAVLPMRSLTRPGFQAARDGDLKELHLGGGFP